MSMVVIIVQEFTWVSADSAVTEALPEASIVPLKSISSSLIQVQNNILVWLHVMYTLFLDGAAG